MAAGSMFSRSAPGWNLFSAGDVVFWYHRQPIKNANRFSTNGIRQKPSPRR